MSIFLAYNLAYSTYLVESGSDKFAFCFVRNRTIAVLLVLLCSIKLILHFQARNKSTVYSGSVAVFQGSYLLTFLSFHAAVAGHILFFLSKRELSGEGKNKTRTTSFLAII